MLYFFNAMYIFTIAFSVMSLLILLRRKKYHHTSQIIFGVMIIVFATFSSQTHIFDDHNHSTLSVIEHIYVNLFLMASSLINMSTIKLSKCPKDILKETLKRK